MDIYEFELRYQSYKGLNRKYELNLDEEEIIKLVKITDKGQIDKKLTDTTPEELKEKTTETYTKYKLNFLEKRGKEEIASGTIQDYIDRLEYELKVIKEMGYNTYFLIVGEYINRARKNNISVGPGRGSAAGSLLAYLVGITDIDPLKYDLIFERFLNPARVSMPDIDTDFEDIKREKVVEYVKNEYGHENVATIGTYMTMAAKAAFKDVARTFGMSFDQANRISNMIDQKTIQKSIDENEELKSLVESDNQIKKITDLAIKLEGTTRQIGVHACGVIISPEKVETYTPVQYPPLAGTKNQRDTSRLITQYDGHFLEDIGLLKMDFLGLRNLSIIKNTIKIIKAKKEKEGSELEDIFKHYFETMEFYPDMNDEYTFKETFQKGNTSGVFQFESDGMRAWLKKLKPNNINDIIAMVSLYRPGPMEFIPSYIARKQGEEKIEYLPSDIFEEIKEKYGEEEAKNQSQKLTNDLKSFMDITYGIPVYQEQLMRIVQAVAGFSLAEADMLRRGVGKKIKEVIEELKKKFIEKGGELGYKEETCIYVYEKMIEPAANYSFNKSHAACYALIAYQTAYLKAHYNLEFHAALLRSVEEDTDKLAKFIDEISMKGLKVTNPNVNISFVHVGAVENSVNLGFLSIRGIGSEVAKVIVDERKRGGKFKSLEDFLKRCRSIVNKKSMESLSKSGALDEFEDRNTLLANIDNMINWAKNSSEEENGGGLFAFDDLQTDLELKKVDKASTIENLKYEEESFKTFVGSHFFDGLYQYIKSNFNFISMFNDVEDYGQFKIFAYIKEIRRVRNKGTFLTLEDITGQIDIYLKETLDLQKYDIIIHEGYKGKSISTKKITKVNLDDIIKKAKNSKKYDEKLTVKEVRASRK